MTENKENIYLIFSHSYIIVESFLYQKYEESPSALLILAKPTPGRHNKSMRDQAEIVVIGGGIYGANIAYHLAKLGKKDIVLLEKGEIASGESSHAAGVVTQFATSKAMMEFRKYSI